jgi:hypothetical protein
MVSVKPKPKSPFMQTKRRILVIPEYAQFVSVSRHVIPKARWFLRVGHRPANIEDAVYKNITCTV